MQAMWCYAVVVRVIDPAQGVDGTFRCCLGTAA